MSDIAQVLGPTAAFVALVLAYAAAVFATQWLFVIRPRRRNRDRGLLREPARRLQRRLAGVNHRLVGAALGIPVTLLAWVLAFAYGLGGVGNVWGLAVLSAAGAAALAWFGVELWRLWPKRVWLTRAIDAQTATAASLNLLMRQGYWVFHDVGVEHHRINHLVIGPRGVFCVDSKWRRPRRRITWRGPRPAPAAELAFDGSALQFPGWREGTDALVDVEAQAAWLREWLAEATSEAQTEIPTYAAVAMPGWRVTATDWKRVIVFDPAARNMLIEAASSSRRLDGSVARAAVGHLRRYCEDRAHPRSEGFRLWAGLRDRLLGGRRRRGRTSARAGRSADVDEAT